MRLTEYVTSQIAVGTSTAAVYQTSFKTPTWATRALLYLTSTTAGTGTATLDFSLTEVVPAYTAAPTIAETTTGTTGVFEVQTITMTGEPTLGSVKFTVADQATTTAYNTGFMPLADAKRQPSRIQERLAVNGLPNANDVAWAVTLGTGATTPTTFTATFRGTRTGDQTAIVVDGTRLFTQAAVAVNFADWDGITQRAIAGSTATQYDIVRIGPAETGIADDDTAGTYKINAQLPEYLNAKITLTSVVANNNVSYSLYATYSS